MLNEEDLRFRLVELFTARYIDKMIILNNIILKKVLICISETNILLLPFKNFMYAMKGKLPRIIKTIAEISIDKLLKKPMDSL